MYLQFTRVFDFIAKNPLRSIYKIHLFFFVSSISFIRRKITFFFFFFVNPFDADFYDILHDRKFFFYFESRNEFHISREKKKKRKLWYGIARVNLFQTAFLHANNNIGLQRVKREQEPNKFFVFKRQSRYST